MNRPLRLALAAILCVPSLAVAAPDTPGGRATVGSLTRYQTRLEADAVRVLAPEVSGATKDALAHEATALWACLSIAEWERRVVAQAPNLERALQVLDRRSEVVWAEERVTDPYASPILQMASVHALQRGLVKVLAQLGIQTPEPAQPPTVPLSSAPSRSPAVAVPVSAPPSLHRSRPSNAPTATLAPVPSAPLSPTELAAMSAALDRESYRILTPELEGSILAAVAARKAELRAAPTVEAWRAVLLRASPTLDKAGAVLARRTEVLHQQQRVLDAYDSPASQKAAVRGLESGLERILALFGK